MSSTRSKFIVSNDTGQVVYTVTHADNIPLPEVWMRSVYRDLSNQNIPVQEKFSVYKKNNWDLLFFRRRYKPEKQLSSSKRIVFTKRCVTKYITAEVANQRVHKASIRSAKRMRKRQEEVNSAIAPVMCYGLLRTEGKYDQIRKLHRTMTKGHKAHGISLPQFPPLNEVRHLADKVFNHPELLTSTPDWVLRFRKGRLHNTGDILARPDQQVTVTRIDPDTYHTEEDVAAIITAELAKKGMEAIGTKIRKGQVLDKPSIVAVVFFTSAYHAKCALLPLSTIGRVHLGNTVATARVVASKVDPTIRMLLSEADGILTNYEYSQSLHPQVGSPSNSPPVLLIQLWIDKDGNVSFIKIKIVDLTYTMFSRGESRVAFLVEYIGDEGECRRFLPPLIDQFSETNVKVFKLQNDLPVRVILAFISGDHKALYTMTGRSGGNARRDQFCPHALAYMYHTVLDQGNLSFQYSQFVENWRNVSEKMEIYKASMLQINRGLSQKSEDLYREGLYRQYGRIDRVPAFMNGTLKEMPSVHKKILVTPLNLHNDTYGNLTTIELMLKITDEKAPQVKRLLARWQGLVDAFGQTKCSVSGEGVRRLLNDCLPLESATVPQLKAKYAGLWWLKDTISYHLRLKRKRIIRNPATSDPILGPDGADSPLTLHDDNKEYTPNIVPIRVDSISYVPLALDDHERLKFAACTLLWWLLLGDLSQHLGGRTTQKKKIQKNHLEDKVYPYELARACVEFEERMRVPLSLVNEAVFEASFVFRDELIQAYRSKVDIERERKGAFFKEFANKLAPKKASRSCIGHMDNLHQARIIIIRSCWVTSPKWSLNIRRSLLLRAAPLSYRDRIHICPSGPHRNAIRINTACDSDERFHTSQRVDVPQLLIDPCGSCSSEPPPMHSFSHSLLTWFCIRTIRCIRARALLGQSHAERLLDVNIKRASRLRNRITHELETKQPIHIDAIQIQRMYDGYTTLHERWPQQIPALINTPQLSKLLSSKRRIGTVWDGDISGTAIQDVHLLTVPKLKQIIRYFQVRKVQPGLTLKGTKPQLQEKVKELLSKYIQHTALDV